jgi:hypothetical protein
MISHFSGQKSRAKMNKNHAGIRRERVVVCPPDKPT